MLLTIDVTSENAPQLSFLLHKHPDRVQSFELSFGTAHVFYPVVEPQRCVACLLLDVDPVGMVRGKSRDSSFLLGQYVNDRPFTASSFMSVAISQVFGSALAGKCRDYPEMVEESFQLTATLDTLAVRGDISMVPRIFEPLGYSVTAEGRLLDSEFPEWGQSPYYRIVLRGKTTIAELLSHLYVLIPVFDNVKHYFVGPDEIEKLLAKGAGWLENHPEKIEITRRYLRHRSVLVRDALARLSDEEVRSDLDTDSDTLETESLETVSDTESNTISRTAIHNETPSHGDFSAKIECEEGEVAEIATVRSLNQQRYDAVIDAVRQSGAESVLDLGCGEGKLLKQLLEEKQLNRIVGMDVSIRSLEIASRRLRLERLTERQRSRIELLHGSLIYRDKRLNGFDAATVVEVIEHLDQDRLGALERVVFEFARPKNIIVTTPNQEYNSVWESLPSGQFRHADHRFEWTRSQFRDWAESVSDRYGYKVRLETVGPIDAERGSPTQMGVFEIA
ncbi:MAG: 3' terminal RNA ribose 2'-O-methyltransferase Hen1 [Planctomycetes bacterium]|nr:3' terminal RNA ribose 2'-O-methyltransferase Hen1 [Planctomycetota bacterium]